MIKSELIQKISERCPCFLISDIETAVHAILERLCVQLENGGRIEIRGFGSFCLHYYPPRRAHNPMTGEQLITESKYRPYFKPGKQLSAWVKQTRTPIIDYPKQDDELA